MRPKSIGLGQMGSSMCEAKRENQLEKEAFKKGGGNIHQEKPDLVLGMSQASGDIPGCDGTLGTLGTSQGQAGPKLPNEKLTRTIGDALKMGWEWPGSGYSLKLAGD